MKILGTFERTKHGELKNTLYEMMKFLVTFIVIAILYIAIAVILYFNGIGIPKEIAVRIEITIMILFMLMVFWLICNIILLFIMPQDFKYCVKLDSHYIIFASPNKSPQIISESFKVSKKTPYYLILEDKEVKIKIAYNKEVLKILKEYQK